MNKQQEKLNVENTDNVVDPKIEAIKEIIFGENIKEYESEFKKLSDIIDKQKKDLEEKLSEFKKEANTMLAEASKNFESQIAELKKEFTEETTNLSNSKLDRKTFGNALKKLGDDIMPD